MLNGVFVYWVFVKCKFTLHETIFFSLLPQSTTSAISIQSFFLPSLTMPSTIPLQILTLSYLLKNLIYNLPQIFLNFTIIYQQ